MTKTTDMTHIVSPIYKDSEGDYYDYEPDYDKEDTRYFRMMVWRIVILATVLFWSAVFMLVRAHAAEEVTYLDMCAKGEFQVSEIATPLVAKCDSKTRRFIDTQATKESKDRFFCRCLFQEKIWARRDP